MEATDDQTGPIARLPDGQLVRIEIVHEDGYATVRRIDGEWAKMIALCKVDNLEPVVASSGPSLPP